MRMRLAGTIVVISVVETKLAVRVDVPNRTVAPFAKSVPVSVREKAGSPAIAVDGLIEVSVGIALFGCGSMVKFTALLATFPG